jgi:DNA-binding transcriptional regulator YhcF (GntR family)
MPFQLPMKRQDIADYLGLKIETVSRVLTSLESCAAIELETSHRIVVRSRSVLKNAMEDRSKAALSNPPSRTNTTRKRSDYRSVRARARRRVLSEVG